MRSNLHHVSALRDSVTAWEDALLRRRRLQRAGWFVGLWIVGFTLLILLLSSDTAQLIYQAVDTWGTK